MDFLVVQWLRIHLAVQGTQVRSLVQEDSTGLGATKPVHHNYGAHSPRACALQRETTAIKSSLAHHNQRTPLHSNEDQA